MRTDRIHIPRYIQHLKTIYQCAVEVRGVERCRLTRGLCSGTYTTRISLLLHEWLKTMTIAMGKLASFVLVSVFAVLGTHRFNHNMVDAFAYWGTGVSASTDKQQNFITLTTVKESFDELPSPAKFASGAVLGFMSTRFALNQAVRVMKITGAFFLVSHALKCSEILEHIPLEVVEIVVQMKNLVFPVLKDFVIDVGRRFKPDEMELKPS